MSLRLLRPRAAPQFLRSFSTSPTALADAPAPAAVNAAAPTAATNSPPPATPATTELPKENPLAAKYTPPVAPFHQIVQRTAELPSERVKVNPSHGLFRFFEKRPEGEGVYSSLPTSAVEGNGGRSWRAAELRLKSFQDLHRLWYILIRERNLLHSQLEESRRLEIDIKNDTAVGAKLHRVRKSMARIKFVLSERRHALEKAQAARAFPPVEPDDSLGEEAELAEEGAAAEAAEKEKVVS